MKVTKQVVVGVSWTYWDDATIEIDAYKMESGRRSFPIDHVESQELDVTDVEMLEAKVNDMIHMYNKRALKRTDLLLF